MRDVVAERHVRARHFKAGSPERWTGPAFLSGEQTGLQFVNFPPLEGDPLLTSVVNPSVFSAIVCQEG